MWAFSNWINATCDFIIIMNSFVVNDFILSRRRPAGMAILNESSEVAMWHCSRKSLTPWFVAPFRASPLNQFNQIMLKAPFQWWYHHVFYYTSNSSLLSVLKMLMDTRYLHSGTSNWLSGLLNPADRPYIHSLLLIQRIMGYNVATKTDLSVCAKISFSVIAYCFVFSSLVIY